MLNRFVSVVNNKAIGNSRQLVSKIHTVVMIRHGESTWNVEKRFTGWCDVPLTKHGEADARDAGNLMGERGLKFDVSFTSNLERAWRTCAMALSASGQSSVETIRSWKLNERHYGALQGHVKNCPKLIESFGEERLIEWRRSYLNAPPSLFDPEIFRKIDPNGFSFNMDFMNSKYMDMKRIKNLIDTSRIQDSNRSTKNLGRIDSSTINDSGNKEPFPFPDTESLQHCGQR